MLDLVGGHTPPGWVHVGDTDGVPLWKRDGEACYVATRDMDQLRFLSAALTRFEELSGPELHAFIHRYTSNRIDPT